MSEKVLNSNNEETRWCPHCNTLNVKKKNQALNFCSKCGNKLVILCNCWIKKRFFNCNKSKCPGWDLIIEEMIIAKSTQEK